jgi:hypothetical protein
MSQVSEYRISSKPIGGMLAAGDIRYTNLPHTTAMIDVYIASGNRWFPVDIPQGLVTEITIQPWFDPKARSELFIRCGVVTASHAESTPSYVFLDHGDLLTPSPIATGESGDYLKMQIGSGLERCLSLMASDVHTLRASEAWGLGIVIGWNDAELLQLAGRFNWTLVNLQHLKELHAKWVQNHSQLDREIAPVSTSRHHNTF